MAIDSSTPTSGSGNPDPAGGLDLRAWFGDIDLYLFDQLLKGRLKPPLRMLDAGCGTGRNLPYFLRAGFEVHALDADEDALDHVREMAAQMAPGLPADYFRVEKIESMTFLENHFGLVLCNAVLHFAEDEEHFQRMLDGLWRVTAPGGILFTRLSSTIGIENQVTRLESGRYRMPTGGEWFLVNEAKLLLATRRLDADLVEPLRSVNVQNLRCMTTWILRKRMV
ncbi:MAG: class I SAM-dependent methyltransferase [Fibrobacterota bacterium]|nr:class I SAM-dependent methyltransferase [Fibrobacterota bacterium]